MGLSATPGRVQNLFLDLIYKWICIPIILEQFSKLVGHSRQKLLISFSVLGSEYRLGDFDVNNNADEAVTLVIHNPVSFCWKMFLDRKLGLAEAYLAADWDARPGPKDLLTLLIRARRERPPQKTADKSGKTLPGFVLSFLADLLKCFVAFVNYLRHKWNQNTISQSRQNIKDHYDLGNDLFELFLDQSMTYSCGVFQDELPSKIETPDKTVLNAIQMKKYDLLFERLDLKETDHVLEIGCGWGACAIRAVQKYGCRWTGLTISSEQYVWALDRVQEEGLEGLIEIKFLDYRKETGKYDKVLSIEMIEAVGHEFLPVYFGQISQNLKPGGLAVLQAILCPDEYYEQYRNSSDFIKKYIFPGGHMPSVKAIEEALPEGLAMEDGMLRIGEHYSRTLDLWNAAWIQQKAKIHELGYSRYFFRKWEFYFVLCSALFEHGNIDTAHISFVKSPLSERTQKAGE